MDSFFLQEETEEEKKNLDKSRAWKTNVVEDVCMLQMRHVIFSLTWHNGWGEGAAAAAGGKAQWAQFLDTSGLPHPSREGDVHIFFDTISSTFDKSFNSLLQTLLNIHQARIFKSQLCCILFFLSFNNLVHTTKNTLDLLASFPCREIEMWGQYISTGKRCCHWPEIVSNSLCRWLLQQKSLHWGKIRKEMWS
jgi:hypothetical protein